MEAKAEEQKQEIVHQEITSLWEADCNQWRDSSVHIPLKNYTHKDFCYRKENCSLEAVPSFRVDSSPLAIGKLLAMHSDLLLF